MKFSTPMARFIAVALCVASMSLAAVVAQEAGRGGGRPGGFGGRPGGFGGGPGGPGGGGPGGALGGDPTVMLLRSDQVREELEISPDQEEALQKLAEQMRPSRPEGMDFRSMSEEERNEFFQKMRSDAEKKTAEMKEKLEEVLFPEQTTRLEQIVLQVRGVQALNDPGIATELGITDDQTKELEEVRDSLREEMATKARQMFANRGEGGGPREAFAELRKDMETKILAVLTQEQRSKFEEMKGEKFDLPEGAMFGGGRGGDRGGARGGDRGGDRPRRGRPE